VVDPKRAYQQALADYGASQHELSIKGFEAIVASFPTSEIASESQYMVGKNYFQMGRYREAITAYEQVIANYPNARILADVYYERGNAFHALGQPDRARESWEFAAKAYPNTDAGRLARQRLEQPVKK
jgi:TolA-binding protein